MNNKNVLASAGIGVASTWFGMHCGSGFATGTQYLIYFSRYGWTALIAPILTWVLTATAMYFILEYGRLANASSYREFAQSFYIKKIGWLFLLFFDILILFGQILGESGILAGGGALFRDAMGMNYWIGIAVTGAAVLLIVVFGAKMMMKISTILTGCLIVTIAAIGIVGVAQNWGNFTHVIGNRVVTEGTTAWDVIKAALTYAGVQITSLGALLGLAPELKKGTDTKLACISGGIINLVMLQILGLVLIAFYPGNLSATLPVLEALQSMNIPILLVLYPILLFLALITTGAGCAWAIISRYKRYPMQWFKWSERTASLVIAVVLMSIGVFGSQFGLIAIFSTGYKYLSSLSLPLILFPALILGPYRVKHLRNEQKSSSEHATAVE